MWDEGVSWAVKKTDNGRLLTKTRVMRGWIIQQNYCLLHKIKFLLITDQADLEHLG